MLVPQRARLDQSSRWSIEFDGQDSYMETTKDITLGTSNWTVEAWVYVREKGAFIHVLTFSDDQGEFTCKASRDAEPYFYSSSGSVSPSNGELPVGAWSHVAYVYDGSSVTIYVDGDVYGSGSISGLDVPTGKFVTQGGNEELSKTRHSETRLWNRALSQEEIRNNKDYRLTGREPGLLLYVPSVKGEGETVKDWSTNRADMQFRHMAPYLYLSGGSSSDNEDYIDCGSMDVGSYMDYFSIEFWIKFPGNTDQNPVVAQWDDSPRPFLIDIYNGNLRWFAGGTENVSTSMPTDQWVHVACLYNDDYTNRSLIYLDGEVAVNEAKGSPIPNRNYPVLIGKKGDSGTTFLEGSITEVRIWSKTLSEGEINDNMFNRLTGNETDLLRYYPMLDYDSDTITEMTGKGSDGTLVNTPTWNRAKEVELYRDEFPRWIRG